MNRPSPAALPHAYPFVMLDTVIEYEEGRRIVCLKNVTAGEYFNHGSLPDTPEMPRVLLLEAMAQASGLLLGKGGRPGFLAGISRAGFKRPVITGDRLIIESSLIKSFSSLYFFEATVRISDELVAEAGLTLSLA